MEQPNLSRNSGDRELNELNEGYSRSSSAHLHEIDGTKNQKSTH